MKVLLIAALTSPLLVGCVQTAAPPPPPAASAPAMPAASSAPLTPGNMAAYCRGEASGQYGVRPLYIKTGATKTAADGSFSIDGTADKGTEGKKPFRCRFTAKREFIDVMSLVDEGKL
jgi:hypothetical protein